MRRRRGLSRSLIGGPLLLLFIFSLLFWPREETPPQPSSPETHIQVVTEGYDFRSSRTCIAEGKVEQLVLTVDSVGENEVQIRGIKEPLKTGDPIIRTSCGAPHQMGTVGKINFVEKEVTLVMLPMPVPVTPTVQPGS